ncbi:hypothetical protein ACHAW5_005367 [Stephanodiscus triporus]|uniref:CSD domain-containing protein n=1 Tax=Stephanodiscus triporus TaxID=2934178 RepID=A0ABD3PE34_9STRA
MKIAALNLLSTLAVAAGFAPGFVGRQSTPLFMAEDLKTGTVKWFDSTKGYGFIMPDDDSGDVFVHQTSIKVEGFRSLDENQRVEFRVETDKNGKTKAMDVVSAVTSTTHVYLIVPAATTHVFHTTTKTMKLTALALLSTLAVAVGFAPSFVGRQASPLFADLKSGTVKWFDTAKGYGFIVPDDESGDIFVHQTSIKVEGFRSLAENERVEFRVETDKNGKKKAMDVTGPDGADVKGAPPNTNKGFDDW